MYAGVEELVQRHRKGAEVLLVACRTSCSANSGLPADRAQCGLDELRIGRVTGKLTHQTRRSLDAESIEFHPLGNLETSQLGHPQRQRRARHHGVGPERDEEDGALRAEVGREETDEIEGGPVGPVHVLDNVKHRRRGPESVKEVQHRLEKSQLGSGGQVGGPGQRRRDPGDQSGQFR